ncbi:hypothetical protein [Pontibacterium sinense]|nr:hypothetical protein [Pontibacterium sinense]
MAIFLAKTQLWTSDTYGPFVEGCMKGDNVTEERCECLGKYVHKHFSDNEVKAIMAQQLEGAFGEKVREVVAAGSQACLTP